MVAEDDTDFLEKFVASLPVMERSGTLPHARYAPACNGWHSAAARAAYSTAVLRPIAEPFAAAAPAGARVRTRLRVSAQDEAGFGSYNPGQPTGSYRPGGDILLTHSAGKSEISAADYALAFVDEIDNPKHHLARFIAAY